MMKRDEAEQIAMTYYDSLSDSLKRLMFLQIIRSVPFELLYTLARAEVVSKRKEDGI